VERRQAGEIVETPQQGRPAVNAVQPQGSTLGELIDAYRADREKEHGGTERKYAHVFRALEEALGRDTPIRSIVPADCTAVRDLLRDMPSHMGKRYPGLSIRDATAAAKRDGVPPISPGTLASYMNNLSAVFNWAEKQWLLDRNPAKGLGGKGARTVRRRGYTADELRTIFAVLNSEREQRPARFWLPAIALYSGARMGEIAQLLTSDVQIVSGIPCISLSPFDAEGERVVGKRLKTEASERYLPIHADLIAAGFLEFVKGADSSGRLFPELQPGPDGRYTHEFSKWWGRFLDGIDLKDRSLVFHSFRHGFRDACRFAEIDRETAEALGGWATDRQSAEYGDRAMVPLLERALRRISFDGFKLPPPAAREAPRPSRREA
jgi:integrase